MIVRLLKLHLVGGKRFKTARNHPSRYGLLLCRNRGARPSVIARQTGWRGWRARPTGRFDNLQLRGAQIRCAVGHAHFYGIAALSKSYCVADAVRCLSPRSRSHSWNPASVHVVDRTALARRSVSRCHCASRRTGAIGAGDSWNDFSEDETDLVGGNRSQQADRENRERNKHAEWTIRSHAGTSARIHGEIAGP